MRLMSLSGRKRLRAFSRRSTSVHTAARQSSAPGPNALWVITVPIASLVT